METALSIAGPGAQVVARPHGVPHVYVGPLTPSGRSVPRGRRTVCRVRSGRLTVLPRHERWTSLDPSTPPLCGRCSAHLSRRRSGGAGGPAPTSREEWKARHAETTRADVAAALLLATDLDEVAAAGHLSLLLFGYAEVLAPFTERGRTWPSLHDLVGAARGRLAGDDEREAQKTLTAAAFDVIDRRRAAAKADRADREAGISRLGFNNATAHEPRRRPRRS